MTSVVNKRGTIVSKLRWLAVTTVITVACREAPTHPSREVSMNRIIGTASVGTPIAAVVNEIVDLGVLPGGRQSEARRVNDANTIVGTSTKLVGVEIGFNDLIERVFQWQNGTMVDASGDGDERLRASWGYGLNESGAVSGQWTIAGSEIQPRAATWQAGQRTFTAFGNTHVDSDGRDINDTGVIVGRFVGPISPTGTTQHATRWVNGTPEDLGVLPDDRDSHALAINDSGEIVGRSGSRAFVWRNGTMSELAPLAPGATTTAADISESGLIAGTSGDRAVLWTNGVPKALPPLPGDVASSGEGVNDAGHVVGFSRSPTNVRRAVVWVQGALVNLGALAGFSSGTAFDINNRGYVVGTSAGPSAPNRATLWIINTPPNGVTGGPYEGKKSKPITLDATKSFDAERDAMTFSWDFGDGTRLALGARVTHEYAKHGTYTATLTVTDARGLSSVTTTTVQVGPVKKGKKHLVHGAGLTYARQSGRHSES